MWVVGTVPVIVRLRAWIQGRLIYYGITQLCFVLSGLNSVFLEIFSFLSVLFFFSKCETLVCVPHVSFIHRLLLSLCTSCSMGGLPLHGDDLLLLPHRQRLHRHPRLQNYCSGRRRCRPGRPPGQLLCHVRKKIIVSAQNEIMLSLCKVMSTHSGCSYWSLLFTHSHKLRENGRFSVIDLGNRLTLQF